MRFTKLTFLIGFIALAATGCIKKSLRTYSPTFKLSAEERVALARSVKDRPVAISENTKATITTNKGEIEIQLYSQDAPNTVANFVRLAEAGFYDGLIWHRYVEGFVIQGGDPTGTGTGGPGYTIDFEQNSKTHIKGAVGMARAQDPNSASCQFYICLEAQHQLDGFYCVFGETTRGMDVVKELRDQDTIIKITVFR